MSERHFQHEKIKYVSPSSCAIFCLFYTNEISASNIITFSSSFWKRQNSAIKVVTSETSANLPGRSSSLENYIDVKIWHLFEKVTGN